MRDNPLSYPDAKDMVLRVPEAVLTRAGTVTISSAVLADAILRIMETPELAPWKAIAAEQEQVKCSD